MKNNILNLAIVLTVGVILAGSLLMPVISEAQNTIGAEVTLTNDSAIVLREIEDGDVLKCERTVVTQNTAYSDKWYLNEAELSTLTSTTLAWNVGVISDAIYLQITAGGSNPTAGVYYDMTKVTPTIINIGAGNLETGQVATWTAEFDNGVVTVTDRSGNETEYAYTWGYIVCNFDDGEYYSTETGGTGICKTASDLILCGAYTSGELDAMYSYVNGVSYVSNSAYTMTVDADLTKHSGTTDIYDITTSVVMSDGTNDETFTPYRVFLPYEVTGHEAGGASFTLLGIIPVMVIVALLMVAVGRLYLRRSD